MKNYHHGNLKDSLVSAALRALAEGSAFEEISLRQLAKDLGVSAAAPYRHFPDNGQFLAAVANSGFEKLVYRLQQAEVKASQKKKTKNDLLIQLGKQYLDFALGHPQLYRLMFSYTLADLQSYPSLAAVAGESFAILEQAIPRSGKNPPLNAIGAWAYIHGLADLMIQKRLPAELQSDQGVMDYLSGLFARGI